MGTGPTLMTPQSPSLKRRRSNESQDLGEKRQRTDSSADKPAGNLPPEDFDTILARAAGAVMEHYAPSAVGMSSSQDQAGYNVAGLENIEPKGQSNGFISDPHLYMRILSLPILESLVGSYLGIAKFAVSILIILLIRVQSTQILSTLTQETWSVTVRTAQNPDSELGQAYTTLKSLFDQTKKLYSQKDPFLSADGLNIKEPEHRATIRMTNLATFASSVFSGGLVGFYELNDHFIETFTLDGEPLSQEAGDLFLSLKTQMFLSAVGQEEQERTKEDILEDFFPSILDKYLMSRHPGVDLAESEKLFLLASLERRDYLMNEANDVDSIRRCEPQT